VSEAADSRARIEQLRGEIDIAAVPALERRLMAVPNTLHELILDLSAVTYLDSSGVRLLHELHDRMQLRGQQLIVVCPADTGPRRVLELTGFGERVPLRDCVPR
jgi:stage II sporulation protein AA (anti-sigma F factor antagonist)